MRFDISQNGEEYDLLLNEEYIGKAITLDEVMNKIEKIMLALKDNGKEDKIDKQKTSGKKE